MKLRIKKVNDISKVNIATLEISGELGLELEQEDKTVTKKDIEELKQAIKAIGSQLNVTPVDYQAPSNPEKNLFLQAERHEQEDPLQKS
jgi:uncharacterized membrane protein YcaP (DUF421 family)